MKRRAWISKMVPTALETAKALEGLGPTQDLPLRPPGALPEPAFLDACTRCGLCVHACPHQSLFVFNGKASPELVGTPLLQPERRACHMCEGFPCIEVCEPRALVEPKTLPKLGHVVVDATRCLPFLGPECGACRGLCPTPTQALSLRLGRPQVDEDGCIGCGICIEACPTSPKSLRFVQG